MGLLCRFIGTFTKLVHDYLLILAQVVAHLSATRGKVKKIVAEHVSNMYDLADRKSERVKALLDNIQYIFPGDILEVSVLFLSCVCLLANTS